MTEFTHETMFLPAHEKGEPGGAHPVHIYWVCRGPEGAVTLSVMTNWLKSVDLGNGFWHEEHMDFMSQPLPTGVTGHFPTRAGDYETHQKKCVITGGDCYSPEGSSIYASKVFAQLTIEGGEAIWPELESFYEELVKERGT